MKKTFMVFCVGLMATVICHAQDVIVKKDGSTIIAKVSEVNQGDIKYKKFSNQSGPTYTINKAEVLAINYENGEKDSFEDVVLAKTNVNTESPEFETNPNLAEDNKRLVQEFNQRKLEFVGKPTKARWYETGILRIDEGSIMETPEVKMDFSIIQVDDKEVWDDGIVATLFNKTNKTIYIDLANCFLMEDGNAHPYYIPTATSTGQGGISGGSVNLGAVTGALGVGGALGKVANGVNIGGGTSNIKTTTTFSQRIVSIPPQASLSLAPQSVFRLIQGGGYWQGYHSDISSFVLSKHTVFLLQNGFIKEKNGYYTMKYPKLQKGLVFDVPKKDNASVSIHITYSFDENITTTQTMRTSFYLSQIVVGNATQSESTDMMRTSSGLGAISAALKIKSNNFKHTPKPLLCFRIWGGRLLK